MLPPGCYRFSLRPPQGRVLLFSLALLSLQPSWSGSSFRLQSTDVRRSFSLLRQSSDSQQTAPQQPPPQQMANPPVLKRPPIRFAMLRRLYQCADGVQLTLLQERDAVRVTLNGESYDLKLVAASPGGSVTKYDAGAITWSITGDTGTLQDANDPSHPTILASGCRQQSILPPASPANSIQGTLNFVSRNDLPATAQIRIQLLDLRAPGEPRKTIGVQTFNLLGRKPPIPFDFTWDSASALTSDCCALYAEIIVDGKPQYATTRPFPVADLTHPTPITLELEPLHHKAAQP